MCRGTFECGKGQTYAPLLARKHLRISSESRQLEDAFKMKNPSVKITFSSLAGQARTTSGETMFHSLTGTSLVTTVSPSDDFRVALQTNVFPKLPQRTVAAAALASTVLFSIFN
jgi:hypothetical protein